MQLAVIETGGKQYLVQTGEKIQIEKLAVQEGEQVRFDKVLLVATNGSVQVGKPLVRGASVEGKVLRQGKGKKIIGLKYKAKSRYRRRYGHRQLFTEIEITRIVT